MPNVSPPRDRNWYKIATVVLSVVTLVISFVSGVYYRRVDARNDRLKQLEGRVDALLARREKLRSTPRVDVALLTLAKSGLPEAAFQSLREVPAVLRIQHASGGTAKGLTVVVESTEPIVKVTPATSVENYTTRTSEDQRVFTIDVPQMRPKSALDVIFMSRGASTWKSTASLAEGLISDSSEDERRTEYVDYQEYLQARAGDSEIEPDSINSEATLAEMIAAVRRLMKYERDRPLLLPDPISTLLLFVGLSLSVGIIIFSIHEIIRGRIARRAGRRIREASAEHRLTLGLSKDAVRKVLGEPDTVVLEGDGTSTTEIWRYEPYEAMFYGWQPHATVKFAPDTVSAILFQLSEDNKTGSEVTA